MKAQSNSKSGYKNISYDDSNKAYVVSIHRKNERFAVRVNTLEEAISVRDRVYQVYEECGHLPTRSDLGLEIRKRHEYRKLKERIKKVRPTFVCRMCNKTMRYKSKFEIKEFEKRGHLCGDCSPVDKADLSLEIRPPYQNSLNEKYISVGVRGDRTYYQVGVDKHRRSINRAFRSLKDAIAFRNQLLDFYNCHDRLPNDSELISIFGMELTYRYISNELKDSNNSSTGLKNISYDSKRGLYSVEITRDRVKCATTFKTLEEAKLARKIILETYDETGVMLKSGEVRAKMKELKIKGDH